MNITTDFNSDNLTPTKKSGSYEWWYFDAISKNSEWSITVIFYHGNPFSTNYIEELDKDLIKPTSPDDFPAISITLYHKSKTVYYSFLEFNADDFVWDELNKKIEIGESTLQWKEEKGSLSYELHLKQKLDSGLKIDSQFEFNSELISDNLFDTKPSEEHFHEWRLIQPRAKVKGRLSFIGKGEFDDIYFDGEGYHDHNVGFEPMKDSFRDWYWGRFHFKESTFIYYLMNKNGEWQKEAWLIDKDGKSIISKFTNFEMKSFSTSGFGLKSAKRFEFKSDNHLVTVNTTKMVDNGPFYQRYLGKAEMDNEQIVGITEYIVPKRIYDKRFWPLVKMRLRYLSEKPHWVQKSALWYKLTW